MFPALPLAYFLQDCFSCLCVNKYSLLCCSPLPVANLRIFVQRFLDYSTEGVVWLTMFTTNLICSLIHLVFKNILLPFNANIGLGFRPKVIKHSKKSCQLTVSRKLNCLFFHGTFSHWTNQMNTKHISVYGISPQHSKCDISFIKKICLMFENLKWR